MTVTDARADFEAATAESYIIRCAGTTRFTTCMEKVLRSMREVSGTTLWCLECQADVDRFPHAPFCSEAA